MQKIILASSSTQRKALLESLGITFEVIPADIDEKAIQDKNFKKRVERLARAKGEKIAEKYSGIIISADLFNVCEGRVLEKPVDKKQAKKMLEFLGGKSAKTYIGFCYLDKLKKIDFSTALVADYKFRKLSEGEIKKYIEKYPVTSWAAGFATYDLYTFSFIEYHKGSFTGFMNGLPTELLIPLLKKSGIEI